MNLEKNLNKILIIDFGSQFTQLIARRVRELGAYSQIISHKKIKKINSITKETLGIILSGGPLNVYEAKKAYGSNFIRLWDFYLSSCSAAFKWSDLLVYQIETVKDFKSVPGRTRDYIYN